MNMAHWVGVIPTEHTPPVGNWNEGAIVLNPDEYIILTVFVSPPLTDMRRVHSPRGGEIHYVQVLSGEIPGEILDRFNELLPEE